MSSRREQMANPSPGSPLNDLARHIRKSVEEGELVEALDQLRNLALNGPRDLDDEAILLAGQHAHLTREKRKGVLSEDQARAERSRIGAAALDLLKELERKLPQASGPVPALVAPAEAFAGTKVV